MVIVCVCVCVMAKSSHIYHKLTDTQQYLHFNIHHQSCIKSIPYTLACRIYTIITDKNLSKTHLKELHQPYPTTLINKGFELAEKVPQKELQNSKNPIS